MARRRKIFLSYRRGDTAGHVGRLYDDLVKVFGADRVFMDVDGIGLGEDFVQVLRTRLGESAVVLVVIGSRWMGSTPEGARRIDDPGDFVRLEVATALADPKTRVIPVFCEGAMMPSEASLPEPLKALTRRNGYEMRDVSWRLDRERLFEAITITVPVAGRSRRVLQRAGAMVLLAALLVTGAWALGKSLLERFRTDVNAPGNSSVSSSTRPNDSRSGDVRAMTPDRDAGMPAAPAARVIPPRAVASAAAQLGRARREWVGDAAAYQLEIDCTSGREGDCALRVRFFSDSRAVRLDATQRAADSAWSYRQNNGTEQSPPLSLEIAEFDRILAMMRAGGITSDIDRARLEYVTLNNRSEVPLWTVWLRNRQQAGRDGRLCFEPRSATRVDCRTGQ